MKTQLKLNVEYYNTGYLVVEMNGENIRFDVKSDDLKIGINHKVYGYEKKLDSFSIVELKDISFILLNSYLYSQKQLIDLKNNNSSVELIEKQSKTIHKINEIMNVIIEYINSYESKIEQL